MSPVNALQGLIFIISYFINRYRDNLYKQSKGQARHAVCHARPACPVSTSPSPSEAPAVQPQQARRDPHVRLTPPPTLIVAASMNGLSSEPHQSMFVLFGDVM